MVIVGQVYWNDKRIGKTVHIDDTLDPVWDLEIFSVRVDQEGPNSIEESTLRIVCLDWDQFGSDDVLGQIELTGSQIKQLAESKDGDEVMSENEGGMGEADMETVFDFIRLLQEHEMDEAGLGKMVVGVPQDPSILRGKDLEQASEPVEQVDPSKKKKRKKKRKHGAEGSTQREAHGQEGGAEKEPNSSQAQAPGTLGSDADPARNAADEPIPRGDKTEAKPVHEHQAAATSVEGTSREGRSGDARGQAEEGAHTGQEGEIAVAIEEGGRPIDQGRVSEVGMGVRNDGKDGSVDMPTSREGNHRTSGADLLDAGAFEIEAGGTEGGNQVLFSQAPLGGEKTLELCPTQEEKLGQNLTPDSVTATNPIAGVTEGSSEGNAADSGFEIFSSHALETGAKGDMTGDQALSDDQTQLSEAPGKGKDPPGAALDRKEHSAQDVAPAEDDLPTALPTADVKNGDGESKKSSAAASPRMKRDRKATVQKANSVCYRDGERLYMFVLCRFVGEE